MQKKLIYIILLFTLMLCGCEKETDKKTISVAVTGSPSSYSRYYERGVKRAYDMLCKEYPEYNIVCEFYDDNDDYMTAEQILSSLVADDSVTAILASSSSEICASQAYRTSQSNKLLVCPHWIYDETLTENNYSNVFSINYSGEQIGYAMGNVAKDKKLKRLAICYSDDKISLSELKGFNNFNNADCSVVDTVKENAFNVDFNKTVERWKLLGVDGVVFIPYDNDFDLFYKLKDAMPEVIVIADASLDDDAEVESKREYFNGLCIVDSFYTEYEGSEVFDWDKEDDLDTWDIHGYNALRMIVDTAVRNNTTNPAEIARALHTDGYSGELESFRFNSNGSLIGNTFSYGDFENDDIVECEFSIVNFQ